MTSDTADPTFACPTCGKRFFWKPEVAGRRGKCTCGAITMIPLNPPATSEGAAEAAAAPAAAPRKPGRSGSHGTLPPPYPPQTAAAPAKSSGVFGGFKRRVFGRKH